MSRDQIALTTFGTPRGSTRLEACAGELYRPANGTEGDIWESILCEGCAHYKPDKYGTDCESGLIMAAMAHYTNEDGYPKEWVYDSNGDPTCTAWVSRNARRNARDEWIAYERALRGGA